MNILLCFVFSSLFLFSPAAADNGIVYLSPLDGSDWQSAETNLIIGFHGSAPETLNFKVIGSISGVLDCHRYISSDGKRLVLAPVGDFALGERVDVTLNWSSNSAEWSFTVRPENPPEVPLSCQEENFFTGSDHRMDGFQRNHSGDFSGGVSVPLNFPELIMNSSGEPVFYWHWSKGIFCVEVQPGGLLTFGTRLANNTIT